MGIPGLFRYLTDHFKNDIILKAVPPCDYLLFDYNCLIHHCKHEKEKKMFNNNVKNFIDNRIELFIEKPFKENELLDLLYKTITKTPAKAAPTAKTGSPTSSMT